MVWDVVLLAFALGDALGGVLLLRRSELVGLRSSMTAFDGVSDMLAQPETSSTTEIASKKIGRKLWLFLLSKTSVFIPVLARVQPNVPGLSGTKWQGSRVSAIHSFRPVRRMSLST